jgi:hypothetical protein
MNKETFIFFSVLPFIPLSVAIFIPSLLQLSLLWIFVIMLYWWSLQILRFKSAGFSLKRSVSILFLDPFSKESLLREKLLIGGIGLCICLIVYGISKIWIE